MVDNLIKFWNSYRSRRIKKPLDWLKQPFLDFERSLLRGLYYLIRHFSKKRLKPEKSKRILLIRRNRLGDAVCTLPLIDAIKEVSPDTEIHVLANNFNQTIFKYSENLDRLHVVDEKFFLGRIGLFFSPALRTVRSIKFDQIIVIGGYSSMSALLAWYSGSAYRLGSCSSKGQIYDLIFDEYFHLPSNLMEHQVDSTSKILRLAGFPISEKLPWAKMVRPNRPEKRVLALCPDVSRASNLYPISNYKHLLEQLNRLPETFEVRLFLVSADSQYRTLEQYGASYCPTESVEKFIQEVSRCECAVSVESGASHIVAALGLPTVVLSGRSERVKTQWHPWSSNAMFLKPGCGNIQEIEPDLIIDTLYQLRNST